MADEQYARIWLKVGWSNGHRVVVLEPDEHETYLTPHQAREFAKQLEDAAGIAEGMPSKEEVEKRVAAEGPRRERAFIDCEADKKESN